ncbi:hypothetical protein PVAP13_1NG352119 [Panicum virgatum]|uniref:Uncharacterized protein n=1 Tax=Panicum virgatum TaxID=38727 RepID=A0A8T0WYR8_PANVG|nr:hypothetical protein PVAP13_1NG352119 [Panicum virgatum]
MRVVRSCRCPRPRPPSAGFRVRRPPARAPAPDPTPMARACRPVAPRRTHVSPGGACYDLRGDQGRAGHTHTGGRHMGSCRAGRSSARSAAGPAPPAATSDERIGTAPGPGGLVGACLVVARSRSSRVRARAVAHELCVC